MIGAVKAHFGGIVEEARHPVFIKQVLWCVLFFCFMVVTLYLNIQMMRSEYPNPPQPPDLVLDNLPQNDLFIISGEIASSLQVGLALIFIFSARERFRQLPTVAAMLILMFTLRGFIITLTPLGQIQPPAENYDANHWIAQTFYHGMFFSGHTASALIQVFFFHRFHFRGVRISWILLPFALVQIVSLLGSHQHYTIDIVGGALVAYFVVSFDFRLIFPERLRYASWMPWVDHTATMATPNYEQHMPVYRSNPNGNGHKQVAEKELEYERYPN